MQKLTILSFTAIISLSSFFFIIEGSLKGGSGHCTYYGGYLSGGDLKPNGVKTSNGETFSRWALTASHRTLPFDTLVNVTNELNGRSVEVRINDRGPGTLDLAIVLQMSKRAFNTLVPHQESIRIPCSFTIVDYRNDYD